MFEQRKKRSHTLWRGGKDDGIACLQRVDGVVHRRCQRVGRGHDGGDHAFRPVIDGQAVFFVILDMAKGGDALDVAHQSKGLVVVLSDLVIGVAKPGLGHGHLGKGAVALRFHQRPGHRLARPVEHGLRAHGFIGCLRGARTRRQLVNHGCVVGHGYSFPASAVPDTLFGC